MKRRIFFAVFCLFLFSLFLLYKEAYVAAPAFVVRFDVVRGMTAADLAKQLHEHRAIRFPRLLQAYLHFRRLDTHMTPGSYEVAIPATFARIAAALGTPGDGERTITIIPGWDLRDVAEYLVNEGFATTTEAVYDVTGQPAVLRSEENDSVVGPSNPPLVWDDKPKSVSIEGYLAPETIRVNATADVFDAVLKFLFERNTQFTPAIRVEIKRQGKTIHEILTMASILEKEVQKKEDKAIVADIFWRRLKKNWALQADSTVHYALGKEGSVFTTAEDRAADSPWNTYKYPGLPPGPICNPGLASIMAAMYPKKNEYWYFLTTDSGEVQYGRTLEEHISNRTKYLR